MDEGDYEIRRKTQNREAQRRYREKQKQRASKPQRSSTSHSSSSTSSKARNASYSDQYDQYGGSMDAMYGQGHSEHFGSGGDDTIDQFLQSAMTSGFNDYATSDAGAYFGDLDLTSPAEPARSSGSKKGVPKAYTKMKTKVGRIMNDLEQTYKFGVEMDLMQPDMEIDGMMTNMKDRFEQSINNAAESQLG